MFDYIKNLSGNRSTFKFISTEKIKPKMKRKINSELKYNVVLQRKSKNDIYVYCLTKNKLL